MPGTAKHPILYEINTRIWLRELSQQMGRPLSLSEVPETELERWVALGFTHIWLMGVWQVGPKAREIALRHWRTEWHREIPSTEEDVHGSPFAIQEYAVDQRLGQPLDLLLLKERMNRAGLKLILDFVPNHLGLDSPEPRRYPARFVQSPTGKSGTFPSETRWGQRFFAHGRDPFFPPWEDTIQVDYRVAETQDAQALVAQTISMYADGLRCDMAMLLLPDIFRDTWSDFPVAGAHPTDAHFWKRVIPKIKMLQPAVDLIAEAYWDRENELQEAGFDFTYNKRVTDFLMENKDDELRAWLAGQPLSYLRRSVHFLENHDEARAASRLPLDRHKAAAALMLFLPGMVLLHDGQLEGRKSFARIQVSRRAAESVDEEIRDYYERLLSAVHNSAIRRGAPEVVLTGVPAKVFAVVWHAHNGTADIGLVNLGREPAEVKELAGCELRSSACLFSSRPEGIKSTDQGIVIPPESAHILHFVNDNCFPPSNASPD